MNTLLSYLRITLMFIFSFTFVALALALEQFFDVRSVYDFDVKGYAVILTSLSHVAIGIYGYTTMDNKKGLDNLLTFILSTLILFAPVIIFIYVILNLH